METVECCKLGNTLKPPATIVFKVAYSAHMTKEPSRPDSAVPVVLQVTPPRLLGTQVQSSQKNAPTPKPVPAACTLPRSPTNARNRSQPPDPRVRRVFVLTRENAFVEVRRFYVVSGYGRPRPPSSGPELQPGTAGRTVVRSPQARDLSRCRPPLAVSRPEHDSTPACAAGCRFSGHRYEPSIGKFMPAPLQGDSGLLAWVPQPRILYLPRAEYGDMPRGKADQSDKSPDQTHKPDSGALLRFQPDSQKSNRTGGVPRHLSDPSALMGPLRFGAFPPALLTTARIDDQSRRRSTCGGSTIAPFARGSHRGCRYSS